MKIFLLALILVMITFPRLKSQVADAPENVCPLLIGETLPETELIDSKGEKHNLYSVLKLKTTVFVVYRGGWCPYCNVYLSALAVVESEILSLGYQIVAISPDNYNQLAPSLEESNLNYQVFSDPGSNLIQKMGLGFRTPDSAKDYIEKKTNEIASDIMPVPALMIVDTDGKILFEYINPDYRTRISEKMLIAVLKSLKE